MMEAFAVYLFKSVIWLTGFALVYLLFLRNERFFRLKRVYLVSGILISIFFPVISIHYQVEVPAPVNNFTDTIQTTAASVTSMPQAFPQGHLITR